MTYGDFFVATPNYNYSRFLPDAISSVREQSSGSNLRISHHIQDGGSTDNSIEIIRAHAWERLSYSSEPDRGQCDAVNRALKRCPDHTRYVSWLNSDEYYLPNAFSAVKRFFERNPEKDIVFGDSLHVDINGNLLKPVAQYRFSPHVLKWRGTYIQTSSTFYRSKVVESGDLFLDERFKQVMDLELFLRLHNRGYKFGHLPQFLSGFRIHPDQVTRRNGAGVAATEKKLIPDVDSSYWASKAGNGLHRLLKIADGGYVRELSARLSRDSSVVRN
ncbi:glycosyltransferase [Williamsia sp.]|uniref:glycosyltransferase n=1 Tax=Williamsia sp. TaxID=1872085 RepID=UPI001A24B143|nr:glycosyltransferase [Williamsia sp.]MBJ7289899.1 glycosyltransferase [Williamsia sp.]